MKYNGKRKTRKVLTNGELSVIPVVVRSEEHTFLSQTSNKGGNKFVFCRSSSNLHPSCPKITIFGTALNNDNGLSKDIIISDVYTLIELLL